MTAFAADVIPGQLRSAGLSDWIAVMAGIVGAFMAALDISVTNSSLPQIQGEIGASGSEGTWIATSYLVAEIVMIPLAAWLVRVFGLRRFLLGCTILFTAFSVMCGFSTSLIEMIVGRVGQGFFGGALIPTAMTIIAIRLPPKQQPIGLALFGSTIILAPVFGPLLGGWLTDTAGWPWLFFLNVPVGVLLIAMLMLGLPSEHLNFGDIVRADWIGIVGLALFLGAGTVVLEEGQREQWFESLQIVELIAVVTLGALLIVWSQLTCAEPVVKLRLLKERSFAGAFVISIILGGAFYAVLYILPVFLATIAGYNAAQTGTVVMYSGAAAFFLMPIVPFVTRVVDLRVLVAAGLLLFGVSCWMDLGLTVESGGDQFLWSQIVRGVGQILIFLPLSQAALAGVSDEDAPDASGLFNMARNLGGSAGLALIAMLIDTRQAFHSQSIASTFTGNAPLTAERVEQGTARMMSVGADPALATAQALAQIRGGVVQQALVMTYTDAFWLLGAAMLAAIPAVLLLRKPAESQSVVMH